MDGLLSLPHIGESESTEIWPGNLPCVEAPEIDDALGCVMEDWAVLLKAHVPAAESPTAMRYNRAEMETALIPHSAKRQTMGLTTGLRTPNRKPRALFSPLMGYKS